MRAFIACLLALLASPAPAEQLAIVGATVVDPRDGSSATGQTVLVREGRIEAVGSDATLDPPDGARVIDARGRYLLPGLVDAHVHFFQSGSAYARPDIQDRRAERPYEQEVASTRERLPATLRTWLATGVTAVADLGGPAWNYELRSQAKAQTAAPQVLVAGPLLSTVAVPELEAAGQRPMHEVSSPQEARKAAEAQLVHRPDFLKFWWVRHPGASLDRQAELLRAVAGVAREAGVPLVVHAAELETAKAALRLGADVLAHSVEDRQVDDEFLDLLRRSGAVYIPTLAVGGGYDLARSEAWQATAAERRLVDPRVLADMAPIAGEGSAGLPPVAAANLRRVHQAGLPIALGSDAGNIGTLHGPGFLREAEAMAAAGLSPAAVLRAATVGGAGVLGLADEIAVVEPGRRADLVLLGQDPLESVSHLASVELVVRRGRAWLPGELVEGSR